MTETASQPVMKPSEQPHKPPHGLLRWIRKHRRIITFCGALIIFSTFIVKDAMREQLRDLLDAVQATSSTFDVREDLVSIDAYLHVMDDHIRDLRVSAPNSRTSVQESIRSARDEAVSMLTSFSKLSSLLKQLPVADQGNLQGGVDNGWQKSVRLVEELQDLVKTVDLQPTEANPLPNAIYARITTAQKDVAVNEHELTGVTVSVYKQVADRRVQYEKRYQSYTWLSYWLYTLGWGLGLLGRLVGIDTGAGE